VIKIKIKTVIILTCLLSSASYVGATTTPDMDDHPAWWWFVHPELPATSNCRGTIFQNVTPSDGAYDVNIGVKGVNVCANITPPANCYINVTYQWLNYTQYLGDWLDWVNAQPWGNWWDYEDWWDDIDWDNRTDCYADEYWHNFTSTVTISQFTQLCSYNENVSCKIENDWTTEWFDWRIAWEMNCSGVITSGNCYYYFEPEECPVIKYIYPPSPNGTVCPCCDNICLGVENTDGHPMNISIYGSTNNINFFNWTTYTTVVNNTYCFCICYGNEPIKYNQTYYWFANVTDTTTGEYVVSPVFQFKTFPNPSYCPCGPEDLAELIDDTDTVKDDSWIIGTVIIFSVFGIVAYVRRKR